MRETRSERPARSYDILHSLVLRGVCGDEDDGLYGYEDLVGHKELERECRVEIFKEIF